MAINDDDADSAFQFLSNALRDARFGWVADQVEEKLAFGKVQAKKLRARELAEPTVSFGFVDQPKGALVSKSTSAVFAVSERFNPQERLGVLLDAIDLAIPVLGEVAAGAFDNLHEFGIQDSADFAPEADVADEFTVHIADVRQRMPAGARLRGLVDELRRELGYAN